MHTAAKQALQLSRKDVRKAADAYAEAGSGKGKSKPLAVKAAAEARVELARVTGIARRDEATVRVQPLAPRSPTPAIVLQSRYERAQHNIRRLLTSFALTALRHSRSQGAIVK